METQYKLKLINKKKIGDCFTMWIPEDKNKEFKINIGRTGYSLSIDTQHKQIFINGYYHYFTKEEFSKFMKDFQKMIEGWNKDNKIKKIERQISGEKI